MLRFLSIRLKILLIPTSAILGLASILWFVYASSSENLDRLNLVESSDFPVLDLATSNVLLLRRFEDAMLAAATTGEYDVLERAKSFGDALLNNITEQKTLAPELTDKLTEIEISLRQYMELSTQLAINFIEADADLLKITEMSEQRKTLLLRQEEILKRFRSNQLIEFKQSLTATKNTQVNSLKIGMLIGAFTVLILFTASFSVIYLVNQSIGEVARSLKDIAQGEGDLTKRIDKRGKDQLGQLVTWFNIFADKLQNTIGEIIQTIEPLTDVVNHMQKVSAESTEVSVTQERAFDVMSSEMNHMLSTVSTVNENADSAEKAARDADSKAKDGMQIVDETVRSISEVAVQVQDATDEIERLETDVDNVSKILDVIRSIAEQTNLLALNAAIEAARAGEQGRGFAVVADEVRTLASKTQQSTTEIQSLIENLQETAQSTATVMSNGKKLTQRSVTQASMAGNSLTEITEKVTRITEMNQHIASATREQESYSSLIGNSVSDMQDASRIVTANIERVSGLSNSLQDLVDKLRSVGNQFKV